MTRHAAGLLLVLLALALPAAAQTGTNTRTLSVGATPAAPVGTTVRLDGLGTSGGTTVLFTDGDGDVFERALTNADIPDDLILTTLRGSANPFLVRNTTNTSDLLQVHDGGLLRIVGAANSYVDFNSSTAASGSRFWRLGNFSGLLALQGVNDGYSVAANLFTATQSAGVPNAITLGAGVDLQREGYTSQTTGWAVTATGAADFRYLFVDEMHAKSFIADLEVALNGGQVIAKSTAIVAQAFTCPAAAGTTTLWVKDFPGFANIRTFAVSDWVVLRSFSRTDADSDGNTDLTIGDCVGQVSAYTDGSGATEGSQSWTFTRGSGGNAGAMTTSTVVAADALAIDFGVSGQGFLVASANDGAEGVNAPYWQVVTWTTAPVAANMTVTTRWGNLNGSYGVATPTYGFAAGSPADANILVTGAAVKLRDGTTDVIVLDGSTGDVTLTGDLLLSTGGTVTSTGSFSITPTAGLLFTDSTGNTDYPRMVRWSGGSFVRGAGTSLVMTTGIGSGGRSGSIAMQGSPSVGGEVAFTSHDGTSSSQASFQAHSSGASTLLAGSIYPSTGATLVDGTATLGLSSARYDNINLALDPNAAPAFVITNKGGGGADAASALGYIAGASKTVTIGCGTLIFTGGVLTGGTCP